MIASYKDIEQRFKVIIIPAAIKGNRWSCLVKPVNSLPLSQPFRIRTNNNAGFIIYPLSQLTDEQVSRMKSILMELS